MYRLEKTPTKTTLARASIVTRPATLCYQIKVAEHLAQTVPAAADAIEIVKI
jgi:hypothetical protein